MNKTEQRERLRLKMDVVRDAAGRNLVAIVTPYLRGDLRPSGSELCALSPFTNEKTPSFTVNERKGVWYCFSTGTGGDWFEFLRKCHPHSKVLELFAIAAAHLNLPPDELDELSGIYAARASFSIQPTEPPRAQERKHFYTLDHITRPEFRNPGPLTNYVFQHYGHAGLNALDRYYFGHDVNGLARYWHIDVNCRVHFCKAMKHRTRADGKPTKKGEDGRLIVTPQWDYPQQIKESAWRPLFGEHRLHDQNGVDLYLVESEDTALIMEAAFCAFGVVQPFAVLAVGGSANFRRAIQRLASIQAQRPGIFERVTICPDEDQLPAVAELGNLAQREMGVNLNLLAVHEMMRPTIEQAYNVPAGVLGAKDTGKDDAFDVLHRFNVWSGPQAT
jgi:hypothetical protein